MAHDQIEAAGGADREKQGGLAVLGPGEVALRAALEAGFLGWAGECGAEAMLYPPLVEIEALDSIDYFKNFPHLALTASGLNAEAIGAGKGASGLCCVEPESLESSRFALPSAACYSIYFALDGTELSEARYVTTAANCFRREEAYEGLRRLLGFYMREIVCIGDRGAVLAHLGNFKTLIGETLGSIGLPFEIEPSSDPFYEAGGSRAIMQKVFPVKEEVVYDGSLAIASVNFHRNFFGERCNIRTADGEYAYSGCVAFGVERWIAALTEHFGESAAQVALRIPQAFSDNPAGSAR